MAVNQLILPGEAEEGPFIQDPLQGFWFAHLWMMPILCAQRWHWILGCCFQLLFWKIANWHCVGHFRWTVEGLSCPYLCIPFPPNCPPVQSATWRWAECPVLPSRTLLGILKMELCIHVNANSLTNLTAPPTTVPCPCYSTVAIKTSFWMCTILSLFCKYAHLCDFFLMLHISNIIRYIAIFCLP